MGQSGGWEITDEMVERGARAAWEAMRARAEHYRLAPFDEIDEGAREKLRGDARATLEAALRGRTDRSREGGQ